MLSKSKRLNGALATCLKDGLAESTITHAVCFLRPTLTFLAQCSSEAPIVEVVDNALDLIESTGGGFGGEFLSFVKQVGQLENTELPFARGMLTRSLYGNMKSWAPVLLMHPNDMHSDVRGDTLDLINDLLFSQLDEAQRSDTGRYPGLVLIAMELAEACASFVQRHYLNPNRKEPLALSAGQAVQILTVTDTCLPLFGETAEEEDRAMRITFVMDELRQKSDGIVETMSSTEWKDASSDLEALSEVDLSELST